jgi:hypothetical protein
MNRRSLLLTGLQAAGAVALAASLRPLAFAVKPSLHPSIQANIDYWMEAAPEWLAECPPFHTSYYAVKEDGHLRIYAVKWNGPNLNDHVLSVPANEGELIAQVQQVIGFARPLRPMDIGDVVYERDGHTYRFCSYVYNSPLRLQKKWQGSMASSLIAAGCFRKWERYETTRRGKS